MLYRSYGTGLLCAVCGKFVSQCKLCGFESVAVGQKVRNCKFNVLANNLLANLNVQWNWKRAEGIAK